MEKRNVPNEITRAINALMGKHTPEIEQWETDVKALEAEVEKLSRELDIQKEINFKIFEMKKNIPVSNYDKIHRNIANLYSEIGIDIKSVTGEDGIRTEEEIAKSVQEKVDDIVRNLESESDQLSEQGENVSGSTESVGVPKKVTLIDVMLQRMKAAGNCLRGEDVVQLVRRSGRSERKKTELLAQIETTKGKREKIQREIVENWLENEPKRAKIFAKEEALDEVAQRYAEQVGIQDSGEPGEVHASRLIAGRLQKLQEDLQSFIEKWEKNLGLSLGNIDAVRKCKETYNNLLGRTYGELAVMLECMTPAEIETIRVGGKSLKEVITKFPQIFGTGIRDQSEIHLTPEETHYSIPEETYELPANSIGGRMQKERKSENDRDLVNKDVAMSAMTSYNEGIRALIGIDYLMDKLGRFDFAEHNINDFNFTTSEFQARKGYIWLLNHYFGIEYQHDGLKNIAADLQKWTPLKNYIKTDGEKRGLPNNPEVNKSIEAIYEIGEKVGEER